MYGVILGVIDPIPSHGDSYWEYRKRFVKELVPNPTYYSENSKQLSLNKLQELADYAESHKLSEVNEILDWIDEKIKSVELNQLACIHKDFHPGNIIVSEKDKKSYVIDWHEFQIMDYRLDLAWTSMLLQCHAFVKKK